MIDCIVQYCGPADARGWRRVRCKRCNTLYAPTPDPPERFHAQCSAAVLPCAHKGPEIRQQVCPTCTGSVRLKVFACAEHGECTAIKALEDVQGCAMCGDYQATR